MKKDRSKEAMLNRLRERRRSRSRSLYQGPGLVVGRRSDGSFATIPDAVREQTHIHVLGPSGFGKSFLLFTLCVQEMLRGRGLVVVDPAGQLVRMLQNWAAHNLPPDKLIVVNPLLPHVPKLNPLQSRGVLGSGSALAAQCLIRVAGATSFEQTPRLGKYLPAACLALEACGLPLALLPYLLGIGPAAAAFRGRLLPRVEDPFCRFVWEEFNGLSRHDQVEHLESSGNRIAPFVSSEPMRRAVTFATGNLDWGRAFDEGAVVLIDLGAVNGRMLSDEERRLVGLMTWQGAFQAGLRRDPTTARPVTFVVDELGAVVSEDCAPSLDLLRKHKISFILSHQRRDQVELVSRNVWSSVMTNARIKIVFGGLPREDAELMARELFTGDIDLAEVKYETQAVAFRPITTWAEVIGTSEGGASSRGGSRSRGGSAGFSSSATTGTSAVFTSDGIFTLGPTGWTQSDSFAEAQSQSESWSESQSWSDSRTWSTTKTRVPVTTFEEFLQPASKTFYSLEEQWEKKVALLKCVPRRFLCLTMPIPGHCVEVVRTLDVRETIVPVRVGEEYVAASCTAAPCLAPAPHADAEFQRLLLSQGLEPVTIVEEPSTFAVPEREETTHERTRTAGLPRRMGRRRKGRPAP